MKAGFSLVNPDYRRVVRLKPREGRGNNRSVMPFDVLGRTRATLVGAESGMSWGEKQFSAWRTWAGRPG